MTNNADHRRQKVKELFASALSEEPAARDALLEDACSGDPGLREEVEQLLNDYGSGLQLFSGFRDAIAGAAQELVGPARTLSPGDLVSGRFRIVEFLGKGGMGEVYEAEDLFLKRENVALKTLPALAADDQRAIDQLKHEIALARRVTHPNVCRVFDVDQHQSSSGGLITFFTMELLKGETLAQRLRQRGRMSTTAARPLVDQMVSALGAAHSAGVVHGDFKPANVILVPRPDSSDRVVVTDFGLAHRVPTTSVVTSTGSGDPGWGTPTYMAPEQIERGPVSYATDIYAMGTVLYEMVTGKPPFETRSPLDLAIHKLQHEPRPAHELVKDLDSRWQIAIHRCLQRNPDARFRTTDELRRALDGSSTKSRIGSARAVGLAALSVVVLLSFPPVRAWVMSKSATAAGMFVTERSIVLLPFTGPDSTPASAAFGRGLAVVLTDQIRMALELEHLEHRFWVLPAAEAIDAGLNTPLAAQRTIGANLILRGNVDADNGRTLMTLNVDSASPRGIMAMGGQKFEAHAASETLLPAALKHLTQILGLTLSPVTLQEVTAGNSTLPTAEDFYIHGRGYLAAGPPGLDLAIEAFQRAVQLDGQYALAHAALTDAYRRKYMATLDLAFISRAKASADTAISISPSIAYVHVVSGLLYKTTGQDARAIRELQAGLQADPGVVDARRGLAEAYEAEESLKMAEDVYRQQITDYPHYWNGYQQLGTFLVRHGRYTEAETNFLNGLQYAPDNARAINNLAGLYILTERFAAAEIELRKGLRLAPEVLLYNNLSWVYVFQERFREAVDPMERAVRLPGADSFHWGNLARVYRWALQEQQANTTYERAIRLARQETSVNPRNARIRANLAHLYAETGRRVEALAEITSTLEHASNDMTVIFKSALVHELIGERLPALDAVEAAARGGHSIVEIRRHPDLARLRKDPRYIEMLARVSRSGVR